MRQPLSEWCEPRLTGVMGEIPTTPNSAGNTRGHNKLGGE